MLAPSTNLEKLAELSEARPLMATKKISILLADVDGTLVDSQKRITERAKAAIQKLSEAGIKFAVTSGRPPSMASSWPRARAPNDDRTDPTKS